MSGNSKKLLNNSCLIISISIYCQNINHSFKPGQIWPDNDGKHINAHGGGIIYYNDTYYWFGEYRLPRLEKDKSRYGVSCYSSKDLLNWKNEGLVLKVINDTAPPGCDASFLTRSRNLYVVSELGRITRALPGAVATDSGLLSGVRPAVLALFSDDTDPR